MPNKPLAAGLREQQPDLAPDQAHPPGKVCFDRSQLGELRDVEVYKVGTWNDEECTLQELQEIVDNFNLLKEPPPGAEAPELEVPVTLGHLDPLLQTSEPAWGWVTHVELRGERLFATFSGVQPQLMADIAAGKYRNCSVEVYPEYPRADGTKLGHTLKAVAVLGGAQPAVSGMRPLSDSLLSAAGVQRVWRGWANKAKTTLRRADDDELTDDDVATLARSRMARAIYNGDWRGPIPRAYAHLAKKTRRFAMPAAPAKTKAKATRYFRFVDDTRAGRLAKYAEMARRVVHGKAQPTEPTPATDPVADWPEPQHPYSVIARHFNAHKAQYRRQGMTLAKLFKAYDSERRTDPTLCGGRFLRLADKPKDPEPVRKPGQRFADDGREMLPGFKMSREDCIAALVDKGHKREGLAALSDEKLKALFERAMPDPLNAARSTGESFSAQWARAHAFKRPVRDEFQL